MTTALNFSYDGLSELGRTIFERTSLFVNGFDVAGAAVVSAVAQEELVGGLAELVGSSLVQVDGTGRYRYLEPVRQFAAEQLAHVGSLDSTQRRLVVWAQVVAAQGVTNWLTPPDGRSKLWPSPDHRNLDAAFSYALDHREAEAAITIATALCRHWIISHTGNAHERAEAANSLADDNLTPFIRACGLLAVGITAAFRWRVQRSKHALAEALAMFEDQGRVHAQAEASFSLASVSNDRSHMRQARALAERVGMDHFVGWLLLLEASLAAEHPESRPEAWALLAEAEEAGRTRGLLFVEGGALSFMAELLLGEDGTSDRIRPMIDKAERLFRSGGHRFGICHVLGVRANLDVRDGRLEPRSLQRGQARDRVSRMVVVPPKPPQRDRGDLPSDRCRRAPHRRTRRSRTSAIDDSRDSACGWAVSSHPPRTASYVLVDEVLGGLALEQREPNLDAVARMVSHAIEVVEELCLSP